MTHLEIFQYLAARSPEAAAGYVKDMWCRPLKCLYAIDITHLGLEQREDVIETRVVHKKELRQLYQWLCQQVNSEADGEYARSLDGLEGILAKFASSGDKDAKRFVLDVTGWREDGLAAMQEDILRDGLTPNSAGTDPASM